MKVVVCSLDRRQYCASRAGSVARYSMQVKAKQGKARPAAPSPEPMLVSPRARRRSAISRRGSGPIRSSRGA